jgi:hypothetical protein
MDNKETSPDSRQKERGTGIEPSQEPVAEFHELVQLLARTNQEQIIEYQHILLVAIKANLAKLDQMLAKMNDTWRYEDGMYRFYHQSFKVYALQSYTVAATHLFEEIGKAAGIERFNLNPHYRRIIQEGTGIIFEQDHNRIWSQITRPIIEAFLHARYFVEMQLKYGRNLDQPPQPILSGWAATLCLYNIR